MKTRILFLSLSLLVITIIVSSCSAGVSSTTAASGSTTAPTTLPDGATLLQERCSVCHPLSFVEKSRHTAADWKTIVDMMISRGAQLTPEEETIVVNYLAANFGQ